MSNSRHVRTFYLIDLDRTLLDTDLASEVLLAIVAAEDPSRSEEVRNHLQETSQFGSQYSLHDSLEQTLGSDEAARLEAVYIARDNHELLRLGALDILAFAKSAETAGGILTYGSTAGQTMKLKALKLDKEPYIVTQQPYKGEVIAQWRRSEGGFQLPEAYGGITSEEVVLVDDRELSFEGLPEGAIGYWVPEEAPSPLDDIPLPPRVQQVANLKAVIGAERERIGREH